MNSDTTSLSVGGYLFYTEKDAQLARTEQQQVDYLEERVDYSSPESIRYVYEKTIHQRVFKTPIGLRYLRKLQEFLLSKPQIDPDTVMDIPLYMTFDGEIREYANPARTRVAPSKKKDGDKAKTRFALSLILNVMLVIAIISMFYISFFSEQPNIINYERAITDKYASWEQELTEREQIIREKERELRISDIDG